MHLVYNWALQCAVIKTQLLHHFTNSERWHATVDALKKKKQCFKEDFCQNLFVDASVL